MKKILFILLVPTILFAQKKGKNNVMVYNKDIKYKSYIDTLNSWDFKKELINLSVMDSITLKTFNDLNKYRKSIGLPELKHEPSFSLACKIQSYYCNRVNNKEITHDNLALESSSFTYRVGLVEINSEIRNTLPLSEIISTSNSLGHSPGIKDRTYNGILDGFIFSKRHHLCMLDAEATCVGIYINKEGNCVIIFGKELYIQTDISKYPKYTIKSPYVIECSKRYENDFITIYGKEYYTNDNKVVLMVLNEKGYPEFYYPPYKKSDNK